MVHSRDKKIKNQQQSRSSEELTRTTRGESSRRTPRASSTSTLPIVHRPATTEPSEPSENGNVLTQRVWFEHVTVRAIIVSLLLSLFYVTMTMRLTLSTGIVPSLNVTIGFVGFVTVKLWVMLVGKRPIAGGPFTPQENAIIQACVGAAISIVFSGGFGNYIFAMSSKTANQYSEASTRKDVMDLSLGWMIIFLLAVSFVGFGLAIPLWKVLIVDFKLPYPSGTVSGHLINNLHAHDILVKEEVRVLLVSSACSFFWSGLRWIFTRGVGCGLVFPVPFPKAYENGFYLELSAAYAGIGMLCSYMINISQLVGGILSSAILWPFFNGKKGDWYSAELEPTSMYGLQGYKVFLAVATLFGEGFYECLVFGLLTYSGLYETLCTRISGPRTSDDNRRYEVFRENQIENRIAFYIYVFGSAVAITLVPWIFDHQLNWFNILVIYLATPLLAVYNAYGYGRTDLSLTSTFGKMTIFFIGGWAQASGGGVISGLAACGLVMGKVTTASDLLHDFTTGYMTLTSPRSILVSQFIGITMGCIICPCVFCFFFQSFDDLGILGSTYSVPYALVYRGMSALAIDGVSTLPKYCLNFCAVFFFMAVIISFIKDVCESKKLVKFIPGPMAMAIGILTRFVGAAPDSVASNFSLDMCFGSFIKFIWQKCNKENAEAHGLAVASGLICGEGIWVLLSLCLALGGVKAPFCMKLLSDKEMTKLEIRQQ